MRFVKKPGLVSEGVLLDKSFLSSLSNEKKIYILYSQNFDCKIKLKGNGPNPDFVNCQNVFFFKSKPEFLKNIGSFDYKRPHCKSGWGQIKNRFIVFFSM